MFQGRISGEVFYMCISVLSIHFCFYRFNISKAVYPKNPNKSAGCNVCDIFVYARSAVQWRDVIYMYYIYVPYCGKYVFILL